MVNSDSMIGDVKLSTPAKAISPEVAQAAETPSTKEVVAGSQEVAEMPTKTELALAPIEKNSSNIFLFGVDVVIKKTGSVIKSVVSELDGSKRMEAEAIQRALSAAATRIETVQRGRSSRRSSAKQAEIRAAERSLSVWQYEQLTEEVAKANEANEADRQRVRHIYMMLAAVFLLTGVLLANWEILVANWEILIAKWAVASEPAQVQLQSPRRKAWWQKLAKWR
uniref:Uncharacterized protein n=1 Tax=Haptolina brevifila TaxID=156173 RepID=A0A7S2J876_9EUKA